MLGASVAVDWLSLGLASAQLALVAFYLLSAALISGIVAAPFALIDWLAIPKETPARRAGAVQVAGNVGMLLLLIERWTLQESLPGWPHWPAYALSWICALATLLVAWLGAKQTIRRGNGACTSTLRTQHE